MTSHTLAFSSAKLEDRPTSATSVNAKANRKLTSETISFQKSLLRKFSLLKNRSQWSASYSCQLMKKDLKKWQNILKLMKITKQLNYN